MIYNKNKKINYQNLIKNFYLNQNIYQTKKKLKNLIIFKYNKKLFIHWNKLYAFLNYNIHLLKNNFKILNNLLFVTDLKKIQKEIKNIALKNKAFFIIGNWKCGILLNIYWYKYIPNFIINCGMFYSKKFLEEIQILGIPNIFFYYKEQHLKKNTSLTYLLPLYFQKLKIFKIINNILIFITFNTTQKKFPFFIFNWKKKGIEKIKNYRQIKKKKIYTLNLNFKKIKLNSLFFYKFSKINLETFNSKIKYILTKTNKFKKNWIYFQYKKRKKLNWFIKKIQKTYLFLYFLNLKKKKNIFTLQKKIIQKTQDIIENWISLQFF